MNKILTTLLSVLALMFFAKSPNVLAQEESNIPSPPNLITDEQLTVNKTLFGDTILIGKDILIQETINGDVFAVGESVTVESPINGDLRIISIRAEVKSVVDGTFAFISQNIYITSIGEINKDVYGMTKDFNLEGRIGKDLNLGYSYDANIIIDGKIMGNFFYTESRPDISEQADISGEIRKIAPYEPASSKADFIVVRIFYTLVLLVITIFIIRTRRDILEKAVSEVESKFSKHLLSGLISAGVIVLTGFLSFASGAGIPITLILAGYVAIVAYLSPIITSVWIGKRVFKTKNIGLIQIISGLLIFNLITLSSALSVLIYFVSTALVLGYITRVYLKKN